MIEISQLKSNIKPTLVAQKYLGQPVKRNSLGLWYKSPFRKERTARFLGNDEQGIHDFGTSKHYDIISFVQELFRIDFKMSINKLASDFGIIAQNSISNELRIYLIQRNKEEIEVVKKINNWFYQTYGLLCDTLKENRKIEGYLKGVALENIYKQNSSLEILTEMFINATEDEKYELYKFRKEIQKCL